VKPRQIPLLGLALTWLLLSGAPFYFMAQTGFKERYELLSGSIWGLPAHPTLDNFRAVLAGRFGSFFLHSVAVVSVSVVLVLLVGAMAAYVFARLPFRLSPSRRWSAESDFD